MGIHLPFSLFLGVNHVLPAVNLPEVQVKNRRDFNRKMIVIPNVSSNLKNQSILKRYEWIHESECQEILFVKYEMNVNAKISLIKNQWKYKNETEWNS